MHPVLRPLIGLALLPWLAAHAEDKPTKPTKPFKPGAIMQPEMQGKPGKPQGTKTPGVDKTALATVPDTTAVRDARPFATEIDRWVDAGLAKAKLTAAPVIGDGEFLR